MRCSIKPEFSRQLATICGLCLVLLGHQANANRILDHIRNYDLNDYSLGVALSVSQNPFTNSNNSTILYPYLTSFNHPSFTDDWLLLTDGELGVRRVFQNGWEYGAVGRIQTLSLGSDRPPELQGLLDREWALELAPFVGYRGWPVHLQYKPFKEITGRHGGWEHNFRLSYPINLDKGFVIPSLSIQHMDDTYTDYYFSVTEIESRPGRPVYDPGPATNLRAQLRIGYRVWEKWLLTLRVAYEFLDDEIQNSPIVDKEGTWATSVGLAYNADIFRPREFDEDIGPIPRLSIRAGVFQNHVNTVIRTVDMNGVPNPPYEVGRNSAGSEDGTAHQLEAVLRVGHFHKLEFGYFDFERELISTLERPVQIRDTVFDEGSDVVLRSGLEVGRIGYSYSLMHDGQKELSIMGGIHNAKVTTELFRVGDGEIETAEASSPLPVIGLSGHISLGEKTNLGARLHFFALDFDDFEGNMSTVNVAVEHRLWEAFSVGVGYNYFRMKLEADSFDFRGSITTTHHGPFMFLGVHF